MNDDHAHARELAAAALDFELDPTEQLELDEHLATCDPCRAHAAALRNNAVALSALAQVDAPERVRRAVLAGRPARASSTRALALAMSLAVLTLVPLGVAALYRGSLGIGGGGTEGGGGVPVVTPGVAATGAPTQAPSPSPSPSIAPGHSSAP